MKRLLILLPLLLLSFLSLSQTDEQKKVIFDWWANGDSAPGYQVPEIVIQYNSSDATYLTTGGVLRPDLASFRTNSNVISILKVTDNANPNTGASFAFPEDRLVIMEMQGSGTNGKAKFMNRDGTFDREVSLTGASQGLSYDDINNRLFGYNASNIVNIYNATTGTLIESFNTPAGYTGGTLHYDRFTGKLYITDTGATSGDIQPVLVYEKISGTWTLTETKWFRCGEGFYQDYIRDKFLMWELSPTSTIDYVHTFNQTGPVYLEQFNVPIPSPYKEAVVCDPKDGTFWLQIDDGFHAAVTDGNCIFHFDPRKVFRKYLRFPDMVTFDYFRVPTNSKSGSYNYQTVTTSNFIESPVIDFAAHTGQQTIGNWTIAGNYEIEYRSSSSAPSTTRITADYLGTVGYYDANGSNSGWGTATPSAWTTSLPTDRYFQFRIKPLEPTPTPAEWTPESLGSDLVLWMEFDAQFSGAVRVINVTDNSLNFVRAYNKTATGNFHTNVESSTSIQPQWNAGTSAMRMATRNWTIASPATLLSQQQGEINVVGAKTATTTPGPMVVATESGQAGVSQYAVEHYSSTDTSPAINSAVGTRISDASANVIAKSGSTADANLTFKMRTVSSDGSTLKVFINKVEQTVSMGAGSNTGQWFGDVSQTTPELRLGRRTATAGSVGGYDFRGIVWTNRPLTTQERSDLYDYFVSRGLLYWFDVEEGNAIKTLQDQIDEIEKSFQLMEEEEYELVG